MTPTNNLNSVKSLNSFAVTATAPAIYHLHTIDDLTKSLTEIKPPFYILGEGSNTLFVESATPSILHPQFMGIELEEYADHYLVKVKAGENWHQLVNYCVEQDIGGLENLALIPGSVGAAPVQNIGAYGVEFADICHSVSWYQFATKSVQTLSNAECRFEYRNSIFKNQLKNKGMIVEVCLKLNKQWQAKLSYAGLSELDEASSPQQVMQQVIAIRQSKLPDPLELPNAGSFFKNPIVSESQFVELAARFGEFPHYPLIDENGVNKVKLAAGWLIEHAGLKGYQQNGVGVHTKQALVLVNHASEKGSDVLALAMLVQQKVMTKFGIMLEPEVRLVSANGEINEDSEHS